MAISGVGRGRGWLNIKKNPNLRNGRKPGIGYVAGVTPSPSSILSTADSQINISSPTYSNTGSSPLKYPMLISAIEQLNTDDDGIRINQKFKIIKDTWTACCPTSTEVEDSFDFVYQRCLDDVVFAMKVVTIVTSNTFSKMEILEVKIRTLFMQRIQHTYENCGHLQTSRPNNFRIAVRILSEFYNKARLSTGKQISVLGLPLVHYFGMLLKSAQPADIQLFIAGLYLNGATIKSEFPEQLDDLLCDVRKTLIFNSELTHVSKRHLLLAVDLGNNGFRSMPKEILKFYEEGLEDEDLVYSENDCQ